MLNHPREQPGCSGVIFPGMAFHLRAAVETLLSCVCDLGTTEAQPSTAGPDELSAVCEAESQPRDWGRWRRRRFKRLSWHAIRNSLNW